MANFTTAPNTGSIETLGTGVNVTSTAISTNIIITVRNPQNGNSVPVGAVQSLQVTESREVKPIDEVGTDGHIDSVPTKSTDISGNCVRVRFEKLRIAEAFDRSYMHVASQIYPFDIVIFDTQKFAQGSQVTTIIKNVWIKEISYTYEANNWIISDHMNWMAENIYSITGGGAPAATGGQIGLQPFGLGNTNWIEVATDSGANGRRGSLDAAGLIDIGSSAYGAFGTINIF